MDYHSERVASIKAEIYSWQLMASALRQENRELFKKMLSDVDREMNAILDSGKEPFESFLMAIILQQQKMISTLVKALEVPTKR